MLTKRGAGMLREDQVLRAIQRFMDATQSALNTVGLGRPVMSVSACCY